MSKIAYPKLSLLTCTYVLALIIFYGKTYPPFNNLLVSLGYLGTFVAGFFYAYSFTTALATSVLIILVKNQNLYFACLFAAIGASMGDIIIFGFVKYTFKAELQRLLNRKRINAIVAYVPKSFLKYFLICFGCILIAAPLPTEIGVSLLASATQISTKKFIILAYLLNTAGIFIILLTVKSLN